MKRGDEQAAGFGFHFDEAEGGEGPALVGREVVDEAVLFAVGGDFVVEVLECFRGHGFDLEACLVGNAVAAFQRADVFAAHFEMHESSFRGEVLVDVGDLGHEDVGVLPRDDMPRSRDPHVDDGIFMLDSALGENVEQLRVERLAVKLEDEIGNPGPGEKRVHGQNIDLEKQHIG